MTAGPPATTSAADRSPSWIWRNRDLITTPVITVVGLALVLLYTANRQLPSRRLSLICAVVLMSSSARWTRHTCGQSFSSTSGSRWRPPWW